MAFDSNEVVLILDLCLFLRKQESEYWDLFIDYYVKELNNAGFNLNRDIIEQKITKITDFQYFSSLIMEKQLIQRFGNEHRKYYALYINRPSSLVELAKEIKKHYFITDCADASLCDIFELDSNDKKFDRSINDLLSSGYSTSDIVGFYHQIEKEIERIEIYKRKKYLMDRKPQEMNEIQTRLYKFFERCDINFGHETISDEQIIQALELHYIKLAGSSEHITSIDLHTGSICFLIIDLLVIALICILSNEWDNEQIIASIKTGDLVLYKGDKYTYQGINTITLGKHQKEKKEYFVLAKSEKNKTIQLPCDNHPQIYPYKGTAVSDKGYKGSNKERVAFLKDAMDYDDNEITGVISSSAVIVMEKIDADDIIKNVTVSCNGESYCITDFIRISYFTDSNKDIRYKGNADKNESSIKICPSLSVASEQLSMFSDKEKIAVAIYSEKILTRDLSNLDLFLNNDLKYSFVSASINTDTTREIVERSERRNIFACTKNYLLNNIVISRTRSPEIGRMNKQLTAIIEKEIECIYVPDEILTWENVIAVKKSIKSIANNEYDSFEKDQFVVYSHSVLNYYLSSVFNNTYVDKLCENGILNVESPILKHNKLIDLLVMLPEELQEYGTKIVDFLDLLRNHFEKNNPKQTALERILRTNQDSRIMVLVPKAYYETIIKRAQRNLVSKKGKFVVSTYKKYDKNKVFDLVVVVGQFGDFDPELSITANKIVYLLYESERKFYEYRHREGIKKNRVINGELAQNADVVLDDEQDLDYETTRSIISSDSFIENELSTNVFEAQLNKMINRETVSSRPGQSSISVKYAAALEDGRRVLFTQYYKAYVFDKYIESIIEKNTNELTAGDMIIFTSQKSATLDVVDDILSDNIESLSKSSQHSYQLTLRWKKVLKDYQIKKQLNIVELSNELKKHGIKVETQTIRIWMDDYSHVICPQDPDSLRVIGDLLGDNDLKQNYDEYFESGKIVKKIRANIRQVVRTAVFRKMTRSYVKKTDNLSAYKVVEQYVSDNYNSLFDIGVLESITEIEPIFSSSNTINRPIELQEV